MICQLKWYFRKTWKTVPQQHKYFIFHQLFKPLNQRDWLIRFSCQEIWYNFFNHIKIFKGRLRHLLSILIRNNVIKKFFNIEFSFFEIEKILICECVFTIIENLKYGKSKRKEIHLSEIIHVLRIFAIHLCSLSFGIFIFFILTYIRKSGRWLGLNLVLFVEIKQVLWFIDFADWLAFAL